MGMGQSLVPLGVGGLQWDIQEDGEQGVYWETVCVSPSLLWDSADGTPLFKSTPTPKSQGTGFPQELCGVAGGREAGQRSWV